MSNRDYTKVITISKFEAFLDQGVFFFPFFDFLVKNGRQQADRLRAIQRVLEERTFDFLALEELSKIDVELRLGRLGLDGGLFAA